jgi:hypothetical protein
MACSYRLLDVTRSHSGPAPRIGPLVEPEDVGRRLNARSQNMGLLNYCGGNLFNTCRLHHRKYAPNTSPSATLIS